MTDRHTLRLALLAVVLSVAGLSIAWPARAQEPAPCRDGLVPREAFPGDRLCVSPQTHAQVLQDNGLAASRREPGGGAYGPNTCRAGFVWRAARPDDLVCVTPEIRSQTASDNAASAGAAALTPAPPQKPTPPPPPPAPVYRQGDWSSWMRAEGVTYRYRWGFDPSIPTFVDAIYEVRNLQPGRWDGAVRSVDCTRGVLAGSLSVSLAAGETREARFRTTNCGSAKEPFFKPDVVRSGRFD